MPAEPGGQDLAHVVWLGGSACAGKTTVARRLAAVHGLALYSCDDHFEAHRRRASPDLHPHFHRLMDQPPAELWSKPAPELARDLLRFYADELTMVFEDLRKVPGPVIAEGVGLLPGLVNGVLGPRRRALWLISTEDFRREHYARRAPWMVELLDRCPDPRQALANWMGRDDEIAVDLAAEAARLDLPFELVDGRITAAETAAMAAMELGLV